MDLFGRNRHLWIAAKRYKTFDRKAQMIITDLKFFGILSGIFSSVVITLVAFVFRINMLSINFLGKIPIYVWLIPLMAFLLYTLLNRRTKRRTLNRIYLGVAIITFIYLNSMLQWTVECCPEKYDSMYDWNASKGLFWIIHAPTVFVILIIQGLLYDILSELNLKRKKNVLQQRI